MLPLVRILHLLAARAASTASLPFISQPANPPPSSPCPPRSASYPSCPTCQPSTFLHDGPLMSPLLAGGGGCGFKPRAWQDGTPQPKWNSPRPHAHTTLDPHHAHLMHDRVCLTHDPHDRIPRALDGGARRVHGVRQPRGCEQLLHLGDFLGYRERTCTNLGGRR